MFNNCSNALHGSDDHVWHEAVMNAVQVRMGWGPVFPRADSAANITRLCQKIEAAPNDPQVFQYRSSILSEEMNLAYFDLGEEAVGVLYRCTANPRPAGKPSAQMAAAWGKSANQVQALVETLQRDYKFTFDPRTRAACGL